MLLPRQLEISLGDLEEKYRLRMECRVAHSLAAYSK